MQGKLNHELSMANLAAMKADLFGTVLSAIESKCAATVFDCYSWLEGGSFDDATIYPDANMCWDMVEPLVEVQS